MPPTSLQKFEVEGRSYEILELGRWIRGVYRVENFRDPLNYIESRLVNQIIKVNGFPRQVNRVERGSSVSDVLLVGYSTIRRVFSTINIIKGSTVFVSSWSGGKIKDIMVLAFMMMGMGTEKKALVLTVGVNDILKLYNGGRPADSGRIDGEIRYILKPLRDFIADNRSRFRHLFATEIFAINENCRGVLPSDVEFVNNTIMKFNTQMTGLIKRYGGEMIETHQDFSAGPDGIHLDNRYRPYNEAILTSGSEPTRLRAGRECVFLSYGNFVRQQIEKTFEMNTD